MDPTNPNVLFAGLWDFRRQGWTYRSGGPTPNDPSGSGLFRTTDGGATWKEITPEANKGFPKKPYGRLAVAICLFQDLSFPLLLALLSALSGGVGSVDAAHILGAIGEAVVALLLVLAGGRWLLRPLFLMIASVRSAELFSLAVLLAVLASAWLTHAVGLSLALGAFLAGMMLAETEFRHQVEATIRSYREVLLGLFFITVGMLFDIGLLWRDLPLVTAILLGMLLLKAAVVAFVAKPATKSWFKSLRTGVIVAKRLYGALDAGLVVNPALVENQIVGQMVQATSRVLKEEVVFDKSNVTSLDWVSYPVLRFAEHPDVVPVVVQRLEEPSTGAGEEVMGATAAAIANAFFDATGARLQQYPMTPPRVLAALATSHT